MVSAALYLLISSLFRYSPKCPEKVNQLSFSAVPVVVHYKLTSFVVPGTMKWTKVKALPESAWAKMPSKAVKGKAGSQATAQPNGRTIDRL